MRLDYAVLNLAEKKFRLAQLVAFWQKILTAKHFPVKNDSEGILVASGLWFGLRGRQGMQGTAFAGLVEVHRRLSFACAMIVACLYAYAKHIAKPLGSERGERLECQGKIGANLQRDIQDGGATGHICFSHLPWLGVRNVFIPDAGDIHSLLQSIPEMECL